MKKSIILLLTVVLCLALWACGGNEDDTQANNPSNEPAQEETTEAESKEPEYISAKCGEIIKLNFAEIKLEEVQSGEKITEGYSSYLPSNENNHYFWIKANFKNIAGESYSVGWNSMVKITFDDKYTYDGSVLTLGSSEMAPLVDNNIYITAEVPPSLIESYKTAVVRFAFNDCFAEYNYEANNYEETLDGYDFCYEIKIGTDKKDEDKEKVTEEKATEKEDSVKTIKKGDKIEASDFDFTLKNVELIYELKPQNTNGVYSSYESEKGKIYIHIDGNLKNDSKRDIEIGDLPTPKADYNDGYEYDGFVVVDDGDNDFDWVSSYVACTPLETCHYHGLIECPEEIEDSKAPLFVTFKIDDVEYRYDIR